MGLALINDVLSGMANAGVAAKSARDYEQDQRRFEAEQAIREEGAKQAAQKTARLGDKVLEMQRQRAAEAEERATVQDYIRSSSPGYRFPMDEQPSIAPAAQTPPQVAPMAPTGSPSLPLPPRARRLLGAGALRPTGGPFGQSAGNFNGPVTGAQIPSF